MNKRLLGILIIFLIIGLILFQFFGLQLDGIGFPGGEEIKKYLEKSSENIFLDTSIFRNLNRDKYSFVFGMKNNDSLPICIYFETICSDNYCPKSSTFKELSQIDDQRFLSYWNLLIDWGGPQELLPEQIKIRSGRLETWGMVKDVMVSDSYKAKVLVWKQVLSTENNRSDCIWGGITVWPKIVSPQDFTPDENEGYLFLDGKYYPAVKSLNYTVPVTLYAEIPLNITFNRSDFEKVLIYYQPQVVIRYNKSELGEIYSVYDSSVNRAYYQYANGTLFDNATIKIPDDLLWVEKSGFEN